MTIGGVLVASFASYERVGTANNSTNTAVGNAFIWVVWSIGIIIAVCGNLLHVLNISKKYVLNHVILGKLQTEGWSFLAGAGRYASIIDMDKRFESFFARIEKIKLKAIETMPEIGSSSEVNDILSSGFDDSARDPLPETPTKAKSYGRFGLSHRSKGVFSPITTPMKKFLGVSDAGDESPQQLSTAPVKVSPPVTIVTPVKTTDHVVIPMESVNTVIATSNPSNPPDKPPPNKPATDTPTIIITNPSQPTLSASAQIVDDSDDNIAELGIGDIPDNNVAVNIGQL